MEEDNIWRIKKFVFLSEIWDALQAAAEAEITFAQAIVDSAGVIVQSEY